MLKKYHVFGLALAALLLVAAVVNREPQEAEKPGAPDVPGAAPAGASPYASERQPGAVPEPGFSESYRLIKKRLGDLDTMHEARTVRILTVYSVGRYFIDDGGKERGLVREQATLFEKFLNKRFQRKHDKVHVTIIPVARHQLIPALLEGRGDLIAASLSITDERSELVDFSEPASKPLSEILVTGPTAPRVDTIDDLSGKTVYVRHSSSYRESVEALNQRLVSEGKARVDIQHVSELLEDCDLVEMVNGGLLEWAIVDDYKLQWWQETFEDITPRRDIVFRDGGRIAWAFRKDSPQLEQAINDFLAKHREGTMIGNVLKNRYVRDFDWAANALSGDDFRRFEELRDIFIKYGERFGIEYLMIAAQGYQESRLDQNARSAAGAVGIMQIKPTTAADPNVNVSGIHKADANIHAGVKYLDFIRQRYFDDPAIGTRDQVLLSLAAYNMGPARMIKLRSQAEELGYDPNVWFDNVELAAAKYVGREPVQYVSNIFKYYIAYRLSGEQLLKREQARERAGMEPVPG